jgi:uncharacterized protein (TIGR04255 family)
MHANEAFTIDLTERFEHLPSAPIVEAVIYWQARAERQWEAESLKKALAEALPNYTHVQSQFQIELTGSLGADGSTEQQARSVWQGVRLATEDGRYVAQFTRDGLVFSRLAPYERWEPFQLEGLRLWRIYRDWATPREIQRLGVRFINEIAPIELAQLNQLLTVPPQSPGEMPLPIHRFMHRDTFNVPGHPYSLNVTATVRPLAPDPEELGGFGLILDLDVFSSGASSCDDAILNRRLAEMRWLKNKAFFTFLKPRVIQRFKE